MKIIRKNAALQLFVKAENLMNTTHDNWRAIHINLAENALCSAHVATNFVGQAVEQALEDMFGQIYFCEDGDVIVLFQHSILPVIKRLSRHFAELQTWNESGHTDDNVFTFYDLNMQWNDFFRLCRNKYLNSQVTVEPGIKRYKYFSHVLSHQNA